MTFTDNEWAVMEALWAGGALELGEIARALPQQLGWSRTTLHTYLTRLAKKGAVTIDRAAAPPRYRAAVSRCPAPRPAGASLSRLRRGADQRLRAGRLPHRR